MADREIWTTLHPITASTFLRDLREECLAHSELRMPKWKFRIARDLIVQVQPKAAYYPTTRQLAAGARAQLLRFEGVGLQVAAGEATLEMFAKKPDSRFTMWCRVGFHMFAYDEDAWQLKFTSGMWCRDYGDGIKVLRERVLATFAGDFFSALTPAVMLGHHCLICGKGLTDPASMARWIGPECAGTSSLVVPFVVKAAA